MRAKSAWMIAAISSILVLRAEVLIADASLGLEKYLSEVRNNFPLIMAAEEERSIAEASALSAQGEFDLRLKNKTLVTSPGYYDRYTTDALIESPISTWGMDIYGGYRLGRGDFAVYDGKARTEDGGEMRLGIQVPLLKNRSIDARRAGLKVTQSGVGVAEENVQFKKIEIVLKATLTYWKWVAAGRKFEVVKHLLERAQVRDRGLKERVEHGDIAEFEWKDNARALLQRRSQLNAAELAFKQASFDLALFDPQRESSQLDMNKVPKLLVTLKREQPSLNKLEEVALASRPEVRRLSHERDQFLVQIEHAENQLLPKLDLVTEVSRDMGAVDPTLSPTELMSGIQFEIPLQRRDAAGKKQSAQAKLRKLESELKFIREQIVTDLQNAVAAVATAKQQVDLLGQEIALARNLEEGERTRFQAGESSIFLVNLREQATADTALRQIDSVILYHTAEAYLHAALGNA